ncbi:autophagy protein 5 isoform X3 [Quercus lobata]|uniref:autophagy protein 5 isoform X3 n=1 Tax=Quercus lobata TaxID=97700 RepID=UPI001244C9E8|nr:autophagy protein 5 isoform X3 [Quercus lobata]
MEEAQKYVWEGAIPLQIHLHESEVTTLPTPPPALILAPRIGYLPLLVPQIKPHFSNALPPGSPDTVWFDYNGLPLKWYIPTGVLFDLLCAEPERPWNLTVHFRGYPSNILVPCEGEDSVKWGFINSLKEAAYIINGNCKNVMNMSQPDQVELWRSVLNAGNLEAYVRISSKLKLGTVGDEYTDSGGQGQVKTGNYFTLQDAVKSILPEYFPNKSSTNEESSRDEDENEQKVPSEEGEKYLSENVESFYPSDNVEIKLVRIQGIEPKMEIPFSWVVKNLTNPEHYLHICVCLKVPQVL